MLLLGCTIVWNIVILIWNEANEKQQCSKQFNSNHSISSSNLMKWTDGSTVSPYWILFRVMVCYHRSLIHVIVYNGHAYMASIFSWLICLVQSVFKKLKLPDKRYISLPEGQAGPGRPLGMFLKNVPHQNLWWFTGWSVPRTEKVCPCSWCS